MERDRQLLERRSRVKKKVRIWPEIVARTVFFCMLASPLLGIVFYLLPNVNLNVKVDLFGLQRTVEYWVCRVLPVLLATVVLQGIYYWRRWAGDKDTEDIRFYASFALALSIMYLVGSFLDADFIAQGMDPYIEKEEMMDSLGTALGFGIGMPIAFHWKWKENREMRKKEAEEEARRAREPWW